MSSRLIRVGLLAVLGVALAGVIAWAQDRKPAESAGPPTTPVFNPVESRMVVSSAKPDGSHAEAGEVVCELDPAELRERLASQEIVAQAAQAEVHATRIAREVAVMASASSRKAPTHSSLPPPKVRSSWPSRSSREPWTASIGHSGCF